MIGGLNPSLYNASGLQPARERTDGVRAPAARPESAESSPRTVSEQLPRQTGQTESSGSSGVLLDDAAFARRVQARAAAEDARLEPFRPDELSLASARALQTFAAVAAQGADEPLGVDAELAGVDIRV